MCTSRFQPVRTLCEYSVAQPVRFYEVSVTAIDFAGNSVAANATVVVVPQSDEPDEVVSILNGDTAVNTEVRDKMRYIHQIWAQRDRRLIAKKSHVSLVLD